MHLFMNGIFIIIKASVSKLIWKFSVEFSIVFFLDLFKVISNLSFLDWTYESNQYNLEKQENVVKEGLVLSIIYKNML